MMEDAQTKDLSILIADDHQLVREMIDIFLTNSLSAEVTAVENFEDAITEFSSDKIYDVILLDVEMPGMHGLSSVQKAVELNPNSAVVVFSGSVSNSFIARAIQMGVKGYIPKTLPSKSLVNTIRLIASGEMFLPSSYYLQSQSDGANADLGITPAEMDVLKYLQIGHTNKEIAREMDLTEMTVKMHMRSICAKLSVKNRTQAVLRAIELNLL